MNWNPDLLMAGSMLAACVAIFAIGRALLPKGVRVRIQPVRRSAAREAALCASHFSQAPATTSASGSTGELVVSVMSSPAGVVPSQSGEVGATLTNLVPFSRAERGYALNFSQKKGH